MIVDCSTHHDAIEHYFFFKYNTVTVVGYINIYGYITNDCVIYVSHLNFLEIHVSTLMIATYVDSIEQHNFTDATLAPQSYDVTTCIVIVIET